MKDHELRQVQADGQIDAKGLDHDKSVPADAALAFGEGYAGGSLGAHLPWIGVARAKTKEANRIQSGDRRSRRVTVGSRFMLTRQKRVTSVAVPVKMSKKRSERVAPGNTGLRSYI
jgi:hypothetical protein